MLNGGTERAMHEKPVIVALIRQSHNRSHLDVTVSPFHHVLLGMTTTSVDGYDASMPGMELNTCQVQRSHAAGPA